MCKVIGSTSLINKNLSLVFIIVILMSLIVLKDIFDHGDGYDEGEGHEHHWYTVRYRYYRDHLHKRDEKKVDIG